MRYDLFGRALAVAAAAAALASAGACDKARETLLTADDPDIISPAAVQSAEGAEALRVGTMGRLRIITAGGEGAWMLGGLLVDEWKSSDTFSQRNETDERKVQDNNANVRDMLRDLYRPRTSAREAIDALRAYKPTPTWTIAQMYYVMGFAELTLAETFCSGIPLGDASAGVPVYSKPFSTEEVYAIALAHFDSALALAGATDATTTAVRHAIAVSRGRTLLEQGKFAEAAASVAAVPTDYVLTATFSLTSGDNQIWLLNTSQKRWTVGDSFDTSGLIRNAIPFASLKDPRVPVTGTATGTSPAGRGFDGSTNFVYQTLWGRTDATPVVSGIDARLVEAEARLQAGDVAGMMRVLNDLRGTPRDLGAVKTPVMDPLPTPATRDAAIDLLFREKALWTFSRGQRLPDLRRLVRQYRRPQESVFPTGTFFKTAQPYGADVNFPVQREELANPDFKACLDRKA